MDKRQYLNLDEGTLIALLKQGQVPSAIFNDRECWSRISAVRGRTNKIDDELWKLICTKRACE